MNTWGCQEPSYAWMVTAIFEIAVTTKGSLVCAGVYFGGGGGNRTHDIQLAKLTLSQLSYTPICSALLFLPASGLVFAPVMDIRVHSLRKNATPSLAKTKFPSQMPVGVSLPDWWAWIDLNYRPHAYQACALTT